MKSLARLCVQHRWMVLGGWIALFIASNLGSFSVGRLPNTFSLPGTKLHPRLQLLQSGFRRRSGDVDKIVFDVTRARCQSRTNNRYHPGEDREAARGRPSVTFVFCRNVAVRGATQS